MVSCRIFIIRTIGSSILESGVDNDKEIQGQIQVKLVCEPGTGSRE